MNDNKSRLMVSSPWITSLLASICLGGPAARAQETRIPKANTVINAEAEPTENTEKSVQIYNVRYANAQSLTDILSSVVPDAHVKFDATGNRIVVMALPDEHRRVAMLLKELDVSPLEDTMKVFTLVNVEANAIWDVVSEIANNSNVRVAVDPRTNSLLAAGNERDLAVIEALLMKLDAEPSSPAGKSFRVRIVWFAQGTANGEVIKADDDLLVVEQELSKVGLDGLRPMGQTIVSTAAGGKFQVNCSGMLGNDAADLKIQGTLKLRQFVPYLTIDISAARAHLANREAEDTAGSDQLVDLATEIVVPLGHYVVLGITPAESQTFAFAVQVVSID